MFSVYCKHCGSVLLLGPANIVAVQNTSDGIVVHFQCHAGHQGVWLASTDPDSPAPRSGRREQPVHAAIAPSAGGRTGALPLRSSDARPLSDARPAGHRVPTLDAVAKRIEARRSGRAPWPRAPWHRAHQSSGASAQHRGTHHGA